MANRGLNDNIKKRIIQTYDKFTSVKDREQCDISMGPVNCDGSTRCYLCDVSIIPHTDTFRKNCIDEDNIEKDINTRWKKERCSYDNDSAECEHIQPCNHPNETFNPWNLDLVIHGAFKRLFKQRNITPANGMLTRDYVRFIQLVNFNNNTNNFFDIQMRALYAWSHRICNNLKSNKPLIRFDNSVNIKRWVVMETMVNTLLKNSIMNYNDWKKFYTRYYILQTTNKTNINLPNMVHTDPTQRIPSEAPILKQMVDSTIKRLKLLCDILNSTKLYNGELPKLLPTPQGTQEEPTVSPSRVLRTRRPRPQQNSPLSDITLSSRSDTSQSDTSQLSNSHQSKRLRQKGGGSDVDMLEKINIKDEIMFIEQQIKEIQRTEYYKIFIEFIIYLDKINTIWISHLELGVTKNILAEKHIILKEESINTNTTRENNLKLLFDDFLMNEKKYINEEYDSRLILKRSIHIYYKLSVLFGLLNYYTKKTAAHESYIRRKNKNTSIKTI